MTNHIKELNKSLENISCSVIFHLVFYPLKFYYWSNTNSQTIFHKFSSMGFGWIKSNCEWVIFHGWHKTFNGISWIWTLFHQVNFIFHKNLSFILEISFMKSYEWKFMQYSFKIHKWYSMDVCIVLECMDKLQGIMGDQGEIKYGFNWGSS
jgi:hypothetical protein